jgi:aspartyl-tRNA(Asn)/glutamyl-tRNA(Gln) amidotransferase subunit B
MQFTDPLIEDIRTQIPELPLAKLQRYKESLGLSEYDAAILVADRHWAGFFEQGVEQGGDPKLLCNWMNSEFAKFLNESGQVVAEPDEAHTLSKVTPDHLVELIQLIKSGEISGKTAKDIFKVVFETGRRPAEIVKESGSTQISDDSQILTWCQEVLAANPDVLAKFKAGQSNVMGFLVGQVMRTSQGRANPALVNKVMAEVLEKS